MKMLVKKFIETEAELKIFGATLLTEAEARKLSKEQRLYSVHWWLKTPGYTNWCVKCVDYNSSVCEKFAINRVTASNAVRPALIIDTTDTDFKPGDIFEFGGKKFMVLSDTRAWMFDDDIGRYVFNKDINAVDANNYEKSDVKQFIDNWFDEA